eukprot:m.70476 g.70476  ORF g.70476 m.70476 type:complete len:480 (+) comp16051_c0_seq13:260-1699(+)
MGKQSGSTLLVLFVALACLRGVAWWIDRNRSLMDTPVAPRASFSNRKTLVSLLHSTSSQQNNDTNVSGGWVSNEQLEHNLIHLEAIDLRKPSTHLSIHEINLITCSWGFRNSVYDTTEVGVAPSETQVISERSTSVRPMHLMSFHAYMGPAAYDGYHADSAERFIRGWNEVVVNDGPLGLFKMASGVADVDAVVYHAYGDSNDIHEDIARANTRGTDGHHMQPPIVFMLTNDGNFIPDFCRQRLLFFVVNIRYDTNCDVFQIPNQEGAAMSKAPTLREIYRRIFGATQKPPAKPVLASFTGSMYTYAHRKHLNDMISHEIDIKSSDWWLREASTAKGSKNNVSSVRQALSTQSYAQALDSVFVLCPRGNGPSSMRVIEAMVAGAIPVLLDDYTVPYGDYLCDFALRWSISGDQHNLHLLVQLMQSIAANATELRRRRLRMWNFLSAHHPAWFDTRYIHARLHDVIQSATTQHAMGTTKT